MPVQLPPTHAWFAHVAPSCHEPLALHVCVVWPLHRFVFGLHVPEHAPPLHTFAHTVPFCQAPFASHVCGVSPLHVFVVGVHSPVHAPPRQAWPVHVEGAPHCPVVLHVSTSLFEQRFVPGAHTPTQAPSTHA